MTYFRNYNITKPTSLDYNLRDLLDFSLFNETRLLSKRKCYQNCSYIIFSYELQL